MEQICSACFVLSRRAPETALDLSEMSFGWQRELLGKKPALQRRHAPPKLEVKETTEMKAYDVETILYGDLQRFKRSRLE